MKKLNIILMMVLAITMLSCSNPAAGNSNDSNSQDNKDYATLINYAIEFKANGVQCIYIRNKSDWCVMTNREIEGDIQAKYFAKDTLLDSSNYFYGVNSYDMNGYLCKYRIEKDTLKTFDKMQYFFNSTNYKVEISDIKIIFYFGDQFVSKLNEEKGCFELYENDIPQFYLNNKGSNSFTSKKGKVDYMSIPEGKAEKINSIEYKFDENSEMSRKNIVFDCIYFEPENIWKNKNSYKNIDKYEYEVEVVYNGKERRSKTFKIDIKNFMSEILTFDSRFTDNDNLTVK